MTTLATSAPARRSRRAASTSVPLALWPCSRWPRWPLIGSSSTWLTLTVAGLAMGMIIFIIASGPDAGVRPDGRAELRPRRVHRARRLRRDQRAAAGCGDWIVARRALAATSRRCSLAMLAAMAGRRRARLAFERVIVRPVYGQHLKQILITMGGMIVGEQLINVIWGPAQIPLPLPEALRGVDPVRRRGDREVPPARGRDRRSSCSSALLLDAQPHQARPADPRRRGGPRDGREPRLPHPAPLRRRVRRRLRRSPASAA